MILDEGNYTLTQLATHLQTKLNEALNFDAKAVTSFVVTPSTNNNSLTISMSGTNSYVWFNILTDAEAVSAPSTFWERFDPQNPQVGKCDRGNPRSANDVLTRVSPMANTTSYTTGFVNLNHVNNVYITSPNLGSFDTLATFSNNVIKEVPVTSNYGVMVVDQVMTTNDYLDCSRQTLRTLEFHLRDGRGREIDLKGMYVTFSLVFNKYNLEM